jgi:hypothetical protein
MIHRATSEEITSVMEVYIPHWLTVIFVSLNAGVVGNIPQLYLGVTAACE